MSASSTSGAGDALKVAVAMQNCREWPDLAYDHYINAADEEAVSQSRSLSSENLNATSNSSFKTLAGILEILQARVLPGVDSLLGIGLFVQVCVKTVYVIASATAREIVTTISMIWSMTEHRLRCVKIRREA